MNNEQMPEPALAWLERRDDAVRVSEVALVDRACNGVCLLPNEVIHLTGISISHPVWSRPPPASITTVETILSRPVVHVRHGSQSTATPALTPSRSGVATDESGGAARGA
jgi:hypothetical protein